MPKLDDVIITTVAPRAQAPRLDDMVALPGFAPRDWQATAPPEAYHQAFHHKPPVGTSEDLDRILAIPRRPCPAPGSPQSLALVEVMTRRLAKPAGPCDCAVRGRECITRLREIQAWALYEIATVGGLLGPIGVGHGKTALDLLAPLVIRDCNLAVLLCPPGLVGQGEHVAGPIEANGLIGDYELLGNHFHMPSLIVHGKDYTRIIPGRPVLHVYPFSRLSRPESTIWLKSMRFDTVIADEVHKLRHADTATTSRVFKFFEENPSTRFCGWSGSLTDSSLKDYGHVSGWALRYQSPLPIERTVLEEWATAIDAVDVPAPPGELLRMCEPGEDVRDGFRRRLHETAGVVHTTTAAVDADLVIEERQAPPIPEVVSGAMTWAGMMIRPDWLAPPTPGEDPLEEGDGEEFVDALTAARCLRELAAGFFYRWIFPRGEDKKLIKEWRAARKAWHKELREKLKERADHLDSPLLCARAAARAWGEAPLKALVVERDDDGNVINSFFDGDDLPIWKAVTWPRWRDARPLVQPETEPVWLDDYLARDAAQWGLENLGPVWYEHGAFGARVAALSGLPLHGGGPQAGAALARETGKRSIVASIKSHGTGRDGMQRKWATQLVANPPSSSTAWEQLLGRLHRIGQKSPIVRAYFYRHTPELRAHVDKALRSALYVQSTLGAAQKLRFGFRL